jgi:hypothetical protein
MPRMRRVGQLGLDLGAFGFGCGGFALGARHPVGDGAGHPAGDQGLKERILAVRTPGSAGNAITPVTTGRAAR